MLSTMCSQRLKLACKVRDEYAAAQHFDTLSVKQQQQLSVQQAAAGPKLDSKTKLSKIIDSILVEPR